MTRASEARPTIREVTGRLGDAYVAEVRGTTLTIKPKGSRSPKVRVTLEWGSLYLRGLTAQIEEERREKRLASRRTKGRK